MLKKQNLTHLKAAKLATLYIWGAFFTMWGAFLS